MKQLAPNLFNRRYKDLVEMGRARLPGFAPDWTDYNAHDPGITLMELLAWATEAQLYSLSRTRRDERLAYAALLGLKPKGTQPAQGLIWPNQPAHGARYAESFVIPSDAVVNVLEIETPTFRPTHKLLWVPGRITRLESHLADGRVLDLTGINERGGPAFLPFGEGAGPRDLLSMQFRCGDTGLFPTKRKEAEGAYWAIGVRADAPLSGDVSEPAESQKSGRSPLAAALVVAGTRRFPLRIVSDTTAGLLCTGALLLDVSSVQDSPVEFTLELHARRGFDRPPRLLRIEPNVVPIVQGRSITREPHAANGLPDWSFLLDTPGLRFAEGEEPVEVEVDGTTGLNQWERCEHLFVQGPEDRVYELDAASGRITFGNGLNGRAPAQGDLVNVTYKVSDAEAGGVGRNRKWQVAGFDGVFGVNPDRIAGAAARTDWVEQRREARRRSREEHPMVSSEDIASAAKRLPLLEVARAWVLPTTEKTPQTGVVTLVAMRARPTGKEPARVPETRRWLDAIRRRLVARVPLGSRLMVVAPRYAEFFVRARLEAGRGRDPAAVRKDVEAELGRRLTLANTSPEVTPRAPGIPVERRDVAAWIRAVDGVRRVIEFALIRTSDNKAVDRIEVPAGGLPRFALARSALEVDRPGPGVMP